MEQGDGPCVVWSHVSQSFHVCLCMYVNSWKKQLCHEPSTSAHCVCLPEWMILLVINYSELFFPRMFCPKLISMGALLLFVRINLLKFALNHFIFIGLLTFFFTSWTCLHCWGTNKEESSIKECSFSSFKYHITCCVYVCYTLLAQQHVILMIYVYRHLRYWNIHGNIHPNKSPGAKVVFCSHTKPLSCQLLLPMGGRHDDVNN